MIDMDLELENTIIGNKINKFGLDIE